MLRPLALLIASSLLLGGCAPRYPLVAELAPSSVAPQSSHYAGSAATLVATDNRPAAAVIRYQFDDQMPIEIENTILIRQLIAQKLHDLLLSQGLRFEEQASTRLIATIDELVVEVRRKGLTYEAVATTQLLLSVVDELRSLQKRYSREASQLFPLRPTVDQLSRMLDSQLEEVFAAIADDRDVRQAILSR